MRFKFQVSGFGFGKSQTLERSKGRVIPSTTGLAETRSLKLEMLFLLHA
jgi:hypothetical protein